MCNGARWQITQVRNDGSLTVRAVGRRFGGAIVLPAAYVSEHVDLGYAVTAHRAQGITTDTAHTVVTATTTRENFYVAMTRGRNANHAYVAINQPDEAHSQPHPGDNTDATARSVLYGVMQHVGAELSAHETITAEQELWGSIAQLAAEYETIAQAAQHNRWAALLQASGLTPEQTEDVLASDTYGALSAELRRAEANHHDIDRLLPRLVQARSVEDADDIASVLHARLAKATVRPAGSGRARKQPRLIAGLIPHEDGTMSPEMRQALNERHELIEKRADSLVDQAVDEAADWVQPLLPQRQNEDMMTGWRRRARVIAAYRDRYQITGAEPLGPVPERTAQKIDYARAHAAVTQLRASVEQPPRREQQRQLNLPLGL